MYKDILGKNRVKLGLHIHTNLSDGHVTPDEAVKIYADAGYDAIALTDHWLYGSEYSAHGIKIIPGCEYNFGGGFAGDGIYHIVGVGMDRDPMTLVPAATRMPVPGMTTWEQANQIISAIRECGGLAELAHPAWSVNSPEQIEKLSGIYATEIYNTVSDFGMSNRPYSGCVIDMLAVRGFRLPLLAVDDTHYYTGDQCVAYVMAEAQSTDRAEILNALRSGSFYSTQGPELHLIRESGNCFRLVCSPVSRITFMSDIAWAPERQRFGENLTEAVYHVSEGEHFIRAEVIDSQGKCAWSNIISI